MQALTLQPQELQVGIKFKQLNLLSETHEKKHELKFPLSHGFSKFPFDRNYIKKRL